MFKKTYKAYKLTIIIYNQIVVPQIFNPPCEPANLPSYLFDKGLRPKNQEFVSLLR